VYLAYKVLQTGLVSRQDLANALPRLGPFREIARQGLPASVNMLTVGMGIFVITYFVSLFGKEAVAAYGSAMRVEQIVLVPASASTFRPSLWLPEQRRPLIRPDQANPCIAFPMEPFSWGSARSWSWWARIIS